MHKSKSSVTFVYQASPPTANCLLSELFFRSQRGTSKFVHLRQPV